MTRLLCALALTLCAACGGELLDEPEIYEIGEAVDVAATAMLDPIDTVETATTSTVTGG